MISAYDIYDLPLAERRLSEMMELAVYEKHLDIDRFADLFLASPVSKGMERADFYYTEGKSSAELLSLVLHEEAKGDFPPSYTPEYWAGKVLAYAQWHYGISYKSLFSARKPSEVVSFYYPYHEADMEKSLEIFEGRLEIKNPLKEIRKKRRLSQKELSLISGIPLRTIKAYEQNKVETEKAQAGSLLLLSRTLGVSIEELLRQG